MTFMEFFNYFFLVCVLLVMGSLTMMVVVPCIVWSVEMIDPVLFRIKNIVYTLGGRR